MSYTRVGGGLNTVTTLETYVYNPSAGATSVSGADANGRTLIYSPLYEMVFLNGVRLVRGDDYTATNGSSITGLSALSAGDVVEVIVFQDLEIANALTQAYGDSSYVTKSSIDAAGDLVVGSADNSTARLAVGTDGYVLTADSGETLGMKWAAASGGAANKNLVINGAMQVAQRGTSSTGITSGNTYRTADRWRSFISGSGTWTQSVENDAPTGSGFRKSLKMLATTGDATLAAGDRVIVFYKAEGQDLQSIKKGTSSAEQLTLSFWVKANVTGTYTVELLDNDNTRHVVGTYAVSASATWEKKVITFAADTTGAFDNDNDGSLDMIFYLTAGSDYTSGTTPTTWASPTTANRAAGQTADVAAATNNYWQITGVQLETGPVATPFEFEPYEATLRKCQRYYYLHVEGASKTIGMGANISSARIRGVVHFPTTMRTAPSLQIATGTDYYYLYRNDGSDFVNGFGIAEAQENCAALNNTSEASGTAGHGGQLLTNNAASSIAFLAEL